MAIEDGIVLAKALRDEHSVTDAFGVYEQMRRERVARIVAWGARGSSNKTPGAFGRVICDRMLPVLFRFVVTEKWLRWMYDYRADLADQWGPIARSRAPDHLHPTGARAIGQVSRAVPAMVRR